MEIKVGKTYKHKNGKIAVKILEEAKENPIFFDRTKFFFVRNVKDPEESPWPLDDSQLAKFYDLVTLDQKLDKLLEV